MESSTLPATTVTWVSGNNFDDPNTSPPDIYPVVAGNTININGVDYTIASASGTPATTITLTTSAGTQTGVVFYFKSGWDGNSNTPFGYPCIDQVGRGQGDVLSGNFPSKCDTTLGCSTYKGQWPNDKLEPVYQWLDQYQVNGSSQVNIMNAEDSNTMFQNQDYYLYTLAWNGSAFTGTAFNGTVGTGSGLHSARPSTCTAGPGGTYGASPTGSYGVAYWATDDNGGIGELYVCTATNTWTAVYEPYTYPHPLDTAGGSGSVSSPLVGTGIGASVTITPATYTFASTVLGSSSSDSPETFTLTNSTSSAVTAISISLIGADSSDYSDAIPATTCGTSLAIGASCQIFVSFAPVTTGVRTATLSISDSASSSPQSSSLFGTAIPPVINPTPANPITFGVAITDPSIPSTVKNENQKQYESFVSGRARNPGIAARKSLLEGCPLVENHTGAGAAREAGDSATRDSSEINSAYNFSHVDLFGFLHQERSGYAAGASAR